MIGVWEAAHAVIVALLLWLVAEAVELAAFRMGAELPQTGAQSAAES